jgi:hypothetical protein
LVLGTGQSDVHNSELTRSEAALVSVIDTASASISGSLLHGSKNAGFAAQSRGTLIISDSKLYENGLGGVARDEGNLYLSNCDIYGNSGAGHDSARVKCVRNTFRDAKAQGAVVQVQDSAIAQLSGDRISGSGLGAMRGRIECDQVVVSGMATLQGGTLLATNTTFSDIGQTGVQAQSATIEFTDGTFGKTAHRAALWDGVKGFARRSKFLGASRVAIEVTGAGLAPVLEDCEFRGIPFLLASVKHSELTQLSANH